MRSPRVGHGVSCACGATAGHAWARAAWQDAARASHLRCTRHPALRTFCRMGRGALLRLLLACAAVRTAHAIACAPAPAPVAAPVAAPAAAPAPGPTPPVAPCAGPEPAWTVSDWWPPGAVFRCGCGKTAGGTATVWNDVSICAALGDLLYAAGAPYPEPQTGFYSFNLEGWPDSRPGWIQAVNNVSTDFCNFVGLFCDPAETGVLTNMVGIALSLAAPGSDGSFPAWVDNGGTLRPSFSALASLPGLNTVRLYGGFVDPEIFLPFTGLKTLTLSGLTIQGGLMPALWSALTSLQYLELGVAGISGTLPPSWEGDLEAGGGAD